MRVACRITQAKDTHSEYVILIPFPWQLLRERTSIPRITLYVHCVSFNIIFISSQVMPFKRTATFRFSDHHCVCICLPARVCAYEPSFRLIRFYLKKILGRMKRLFKGKGHPITSHEGPETE